MIPHRTLSRCRSVLSHLQRSSTLTPRHQSRLSSTTTAATTATSPSSTSKPSEKNIPTFTGILRRGRDIIPDGYLKTITKRHLPPEVYAHDVSPEITELVKGGCRTLVLTRESKRNALNLDMIRFMNQHLKAYVLSEEFQGVIVRSNSDKFFCDGGDIKSLYEAGIKRNNGQIDAHDLTRTFFREEYRLNYRISKLRQAYVAVMNGSTMGGGAGISVHGRYRVATRNTVFAMPETAIGFFPDVGASYFLPRLEHSLGIFLGLTGYRLQGSDVVHAGLATHWGLPGQDTQIEMLLAGEEIYHRDFPDKAMNMSFPDWGEIIEPPYAELHGIVPDDPNDELLRAAYVLAVIRGIPVPTKIEPPQPIMKNGEYIPGRHILTPLMEELSGVKEMEQILRDAKEHEQQGEYVGNTTERAEYKPPHRLKCDHARLLVKAFLEDPNHRYQAAKLWYDMKNVYKPFSLEPHLATIAACFSHDTIEKIIHALKTLPYDQAWAQQQVEVLSKMSPTSLKVTLKMLRAGQWMDLDACLKMEYRIAQRMMVNKDFYIGVDAALISRHRKPVWSATLEQVTPQMVDAYFAPFSTDPNSPDHEKELDLDDLNNPDRID